MTHFQAPLSDEVLLQKLNFSEMPDVLNVLKRDWPHSIHTYYFLLNFMDWTEYAANVDFDFYSPNGDPLIGSVLAVVTFKKGDTFVNYHCVDYVSCKAINDGLKNTDLIDWSKAIIFEGIHERLVPGLLLIINEKGQKITKNDRCCQVWMPPSKTINNLVELQSELYFLPLDGNQTQLVHDNWDYAGPRTESIVHETLTQNGGLGILFRGNDSFAGWAVEQHYGGIGMLYIYPEYRRQGYATQLVKGMISRLSDRQIDPFALIEENNTRSQMVFHKIGFEQICMVSWIGAEQK